MDRTRIESLEATLQELREKQGDLDRSLGVLMDLYIGHLESLSDIYIRTFRKELGVEEETVSDRKPETENPEPKKLALAKPTGPVIQFFAEFQLHVLVKERLEAVSLETGLNISDVIRRVVYKAVGFEN